MKSRRSRSFSTGETRIEPDAEIPVSDPRGELRPRKRNVDRALRRRGELDDAERFSDEVHAAEPLEPRDEIVERDPRGEVILVDGAALAPRSMSRTVPPTR